MNQELLRIVDTMAREKNIDREVVFEDLEAAMLSAIHKSDSHAEEVDVRIDRKTGEITATVEGEPLSMHELGRIAAQTAKQVLIQRVREAERGSIFEEFLERKGEIVTGRVVRREGGGTLIVEIGRAEAILPRSEQIPGETHQPEDRVRAMILEVREQGSQIRIVLSRSHPDFVRKLFELEVPEVGEKIIEIRALAREAGYRTKVAVNSLDTKVDAVGACVGVRGSRIKSIVDELNGEKIDIVRWNDSSKILIANALKPAEVYDISLCFELGRAIVVVTDDQLSLAIGKRGQNVRLAARLTGWDIDILTPSEFNAALDTLEKALLDVGGVDSQIVSQVVALGMVNVLDVEEVGPEPLIKELEMARDQAERIVQRCTEEARRVAEAQAQKAAEAAESEPVAAGGEESPPAGEGQTPGEPVAPAPGEAETLAKGEAPGEAETPAEAEAPSEAEASPGSDGAAEALAEGAGGPAPSQPPASPAPGSSGSPEATAPAGADPSGEPAEGEAAGDQADGENRQMSTS